MEFVKIDGHNFNKSWAKKKSEAEFVAEFIGVDVIYKDAENREDALKAAYQELVAEPESKSENPEEAAE